MGRVLDGLSWLVTVRPVVTLAVVVTITIALGAGIPQRAPQADNEIFLSDDSEVAVALDKLEERFGESAETVSVTILFRGDALTPEGLAQIERVIERVTSDDRVADVLAVGRAVVAPTQPLAEVLGVQGFADTTQAEVDAALDRIGREATLAGPREALDSLTGTDADGTPVAIATVRLRDPGDMETLVEAELAIHELTEAVAGPLAARSVSEATIDEESDAATGSTMLRLMGIALLVIAALSFLFMRSPSDLLLTLAGLLVTIVWITGAQGWLGPNALGWVGPPNILTTMVPIMLIGLAVDYAIQTVALYREQRIAGEAVGRAVRRGLRTVTIPLALAAGTTVVSFLTNLASPIPANGDFGITAGLGVAFGLVAMLTLVPAGRALIDQRREAKGSLPAPRPISNALPAVGGAVEALGRELARRPAPYLAVVAIVTVLLGIAATRIDTSFDTRDFLPSGGDSTADLETLDAAFGGSTEAVNVLIEAEVTQARTILNLLDFTDAFQDDLRRPVGVEGDIEVSLGLLVLDWITDSGAPGDKFDPELETLFEEASAGVRVDPVLAQAFLDRLSENDPETVRRVLLDNPEGADSLLIQFRALGGDQQRTAAMLEDINGLWFGAEDEFTATSGAIISLEIVDVITESQTEAIVTTIAAALVILTIFFWVTQGQPALGVIAVGPIVLVLVWVLGTMALLGIPYNVVTALITALSIGIGVDYTIHVIHRYKEEFAHLRDPEAAASRTLATTGSALIGSALTTALGFGVLIFSPLTPFQQFGVVTALTIAYALIAAVLVVPPAMIVWGAYQNLRLRHAVERARTELGEEP
ncbi:MAG: MMPL family transporter [Dehalococcoidia bacterium]|nr:MMPL family transporter [Dehalococcoidia bacterium]MYA52596.1 MMPL family transporter [Dehalococcoidia bacterium]